MKIDRAGYPFIAGALVPAAALALGRRPGLAAGFAALGGFFAYFFRDPDRVVPMGEGLVVSPADGQVMTAGPADGRWAPPGEWKQITIFLSPLDVHVNRAAIGGRVVSVTRTPGGFRPAYRPDAEENQRVAIALEGETGRVLMRQVVGVLARRIVCRVREGDRLAVGERFGMIKFGSRMDVVMPARARVLVKPGDRVIAGESVIGVMP